MHDYNQVERKKQRTGYLSAVFLEKEYALWAEKRLLKAEQSPAIQGYTDKDFWERNSGKQMLD